MATAGACANGTDDDADGLVDCQDADCAVYCREDDAQTCHDGQDQDQDGLRDCADPDCLAACPEGGEAATCSNGADDDHDGLTDCLDPDCDGRCPESAGPCFDGRDNDGDSLTDVADPTCWATAGDVSFERCAAVVPFPIEAFNAEADGRSWYFDDLAHMPTSDKLPDLTPALIGGVKGDGCAAARSARVAAGRRDGTVVSIDLVLDSAEPQTSCGALTSCAAYIEVSIGPPSGTSVAFRVERSEDADPGRLGLLRPKTPNPEFVPAPGTFSAGPDRLIGATLRLEVDDATATVKATLALSGGAASGVVVEPIPASWTDSVPLQLSWFACYRAGISRAKVERQSLVRCGTELPVPAMGPPGGGGAPVASVTWSRDDSVCALALPSFDGAGLYESKVARAADGGVSLGPFTRVATPDALASTGAETVLRAITWDPEEDALYGIREPFSATGGRPLLVRAPHCAGPWQELGPALDEQGPSGWIVAYAARSTPGGAREHEALVLDFGLEKGLTLARGDGTASSLKLVEGTRRTGVQPLGGAALVGNDWIQLWSPDGPIDLDLTDGGATVATLPPSLETGAFDEFGAARLPAWSSWEFYAALAMDPSGGDPWRGLFFYSGCASRPVCSPSSGAAWLKVRRR